jgi:hypothetical protein
VWIWVLALMTLLVIGASVRYWQIASHAASAAAAAVEAQRKVDVADGAIGRAHSSLLDALQETDKANVLLMDTQQAAYCEQEGICGSGVPGVGYEAYEAMVQVDMARHVSNRARLMSFMAADNEDQARSVLDRAVRTNDAALSASKTAANAKSVALVVLAVALLGIFLTSAGAVRSFGYRWSRRPAERPPLRRSTLAGWTHGITVGLIAAAVDALDDPGDRERFEEEWAADMAELAPGWRRLRWALGVRLLAPGRLNRVSVEHPVQRPLQ